MIRDWHALWLTRRGHSVHVRTDPACRIHRPPRHGSRLDRASRGVGCPRCVPPSGHVQPLHNEMTTAERHVIEEAQAAIAYARDEEPGLLMWFPALVAAVDRLVATRAGKPCTMQALTRGLLGCRAHADGIHRCRRWEPHPALDHRCECGVIFSPPPTTEGDRHAMA